ncbi:hypothetical protein P4S72_18990 [Vibrio sp. PP-XX7]
MLAILACTRYPWQMLQKQKSTVLIHPIVAQSQTGKIGVQIRERLNQNQTVTATIQLTRVTR